MTAPAAALARRSIIGTARQPEMIFPSIFFPLLFAALNTAAFNRATSLPGFPKVDSMLDFILASTILQGVVFGATSGGSDVAGDIQGGFFDRLLTTPVPRPLILVGRLAGSALLGAVQAAAFIAILSVFGARIAGGPAAIITLVATATVLALGIGGFSVAIALRTGSQEAVQAFFPVFFISLFLSSAFFPRTLMTGWFKGLATANPVSHLIESMRHLVIVGWSPREAATAFGVAVFLAVTSVMVANRQLRRRVMA
jgi:ABC-2 type transport system permease protein